jgi:hypothetical protein
MRQYPRQPTGAERLQLLRLVERHGTPAQQQHLGHLVGDAVDMGTIRELAASVGAPGRQAGSRRAALGRPTVLEGEIGPSAT